MVNDIKHKNHENEATKQPLGITRFVATFVWFQWNQTLHTIIRVILQQFIFTLWNVQTLELTSQESVGVSALMFRTRLPKWNSDISNMSRLVPHSDGMCGIGWKWTATVNRWETESYLKVIIIAGVNKIFLKVRGSPLRTLETTMWKTKWSWLCWTGLAP